MPGPQNPAEWLIYGHSISLSVGDCPGIFERKVDSDRWMAGWKNPRSQFEIKFNFPHRSPLLRSARLRSARLELEKSSHRRREELGRGDCCLVGNRIHRRVDSISIHWCIRPLARGGSDAVANGGQDKLKFRVMMEQIVIVISSPTPSGPRTTLG